MRLPKIEEEDLKRLHDRRSEADGGGASAGKASKSSRAGRVRGTNHGLVADDQSDVAHRVDNWRWNTAAPGSDPALEAGDSTSVQDDLTMLSRSIKCTVHPIVLSTSEWECGLVFQWCVRGFRAIFPKDTAVKSAVVTSRLGELEISRSIRRHMVHARLKQDEAVFLASLFNSCDISGDGFLSPDELSAVLSSIMAPMHLLTSEIKEKIKDLLFVLDYDLGGAIIYQCVLLCIEDKCGFINSDGQVSMDEFRKCFAQGQEEFATKGRLSLLVSLHRHAIILPVFRTNAFFFSCCVVCCAAACRPASMKAQWCPTS